MRLLITGADRPLGRLAAGHFRESHELRLAGMAAEAPEEAEGLAYRSVDLREPEDVAPLVKDAHAVLHLAEFDPAPSAGPNAEQERLEVAARGTYVLLAEARKASANRVVLASTLALMGYPADCTVDEYWQPQPEAEAGSLAPYLSEIVCREFAREGGIRSVCLRFGPLGQPEGTAEADALRALSLALVMPFRDPGYRWQLFHISSSARFPMGAAHRGLGFERKGDA